MPPRAGQVPCLLNASHEIYTQLVHTPMQLLDLGEVDSSMWAAMGPLMRATLEAALVSAQRWRAARM